MLLWLSCWGGVVVVVVVDVVDVDCYLIDIVVVGTLRLRPSFRSSARTHISFVAFYSRSNTGCGANPVFHNSFGCVLKHNGPTCDFHNKLNLRCL